MHPAIVEQALSQVRETRPILYWCGEMLVALIAGLRTFRVDRRIVHERCNLPGASQGIDRDSAFALPSCNALIKEYDNIPVFSWLVLKGKCRHCGEAISPRYLFVELATAALFAGLAARLGYNWELSAFLVLFAGLLALACIDLELLLLPRSVVYPVLLSWRDS